MAQPHLHLWQLHLLGLDSIQLIFDASFLRKSSWADFCEADGAVPVRAGWKEVSHFFQLQKMQLVIFSLPAQVICLVFRVLGFGMASRRAWPICGVPMLIQRVEMKQHETNNSDDSLGWVLVKWFGNGFGRTLCILDVRLHAPKPLTPYAPGAFQAAQPGALRQLGERHAPRSTPCEEGLQQLVAKRVLLECWPIKEWLRYHQACE